MEYIASQENLEAFVRRAASSSVLAIDTEFLREKTYYANLCLIQLATDAEVAVVDPFAIEDMKVLAPLLTDSSIVKLFHAGGQDLEILYRELGVLPAPLFDTQVAATLLGHTQQIGYGPLVHSLCGVNLKKSDSFTDWSRRPLSTSQLEYAADDVIYLPKMYRIMVEKLEAKGRLHWLDNDFAAMSDPAHYESDPFERYKRLKRVPRAAAFFRQQQRRRSVLRPDDPTQLAPSVCAGFFRFPGHVPVSGAFLRPAGIAGAVCPPAPRQQAQGQHRRKQSLHENRLLFISTSLSAQTVILFPVLQIFPEIIIFLKFVLDILLSSYKISTRLEV